MLAVTAPEKVLEVGVQSGAEALSTAFALCGVYTLWLGIFSVAEKCLLPQKLSRLLQPANNFLFGKVSKTASQNISLNLASNLLGVGNAATPSAIAALKETEQTDRLSSAGTMLFVVNACGVQLVPTTVIGLRAQLGSAAPSDILLPNLLVTVTTVFVGISGVKILQRITNTVEHRRFCEKASKDSTASPKCGNASRKT